MVAMKWIWVFAMSCTPAFALADTTCDSYAQNQLDRALVKTESSGNEFAIGVVDGKLVRQPRNLDEALATAISLEAKGFNFSVGCRQVNRANFRRYGLTMRTAFDPQANSDAGADIYRECLDRAVGTFGKGDAAVPAALSCYYSGNFITGQRRTGNQPSYVDRILTSASLERAPALAIPVIPAKRKSVKKSEASSSTSLTSTVPKAGQHVADWDVFNEL